MGSTTRVIIVGAGIGGLTAAITLRRAGIEASVFGSKHVELPSMVVCLNGETGWTRADRPTGSSRRR